MRNNCAFTLGPVMQSLLLLSSQPRAEKTLSAWVLVAGTQNNFLGKGDYNFMC